MLDDFTLLQSFQKHSSNSSKLDDQHKSRGEGWEDVQSPHKVPQRYSTAKAWLTQVLYIAVLRADFLDGVAETLYQSSGYINELEPIPGVDKAACLGADGR